MTLPAPDDRSTGSSTRSGTLSSSLSSTRSGTLSPPQPSSWIIAGRHLIHPPPADWRTRLATRLGARPRRIGPWVELALYGALACLHDSAEQQLPSAALLNVSTMHGPDIALRAALQESRLGLPLPIGFMASQPGQVLPALARYLGWQGDGRCLSSRDQLVVLRLLCLEAASDHHAHHDDHRGAGLLAGWVDEDNDGTSLWLRLRPASGVGSIVTDTPPAALRPIRSLIELADPAVARLTVSGDQVLIT